MVSAPTLVPLDFSESAGLIVLSVDASTSIGWGAIHQQGQADETFHPARFESGVWSATERKYDAVRLECRGLLKALKKLRFWLFGRFFRVETDAQTLVWLLNQPPNDLPNALLTRWLSYIRLFDFEVKHVRGEKNGMPLTDGIFPESKELLLGYWIVDVATPERAYAIAGRISAAPGPGGAPTNMPIEVRRFAAYEQSKSQ